MLKYFLRGIAMKKILFLLFSFIFVHAEQIDNNKVIESVYAYWTKGVDENLKEIPGGIAGGDLAVEDTHLYAIGTFFPLESLTPADSDHIEFGLTAVAAKHSGMQSHLELDGAFTAKYNELFPVDSFLNMDLAMGIGLSYAFGTPYYEDPVVNDNGTLEYYKLQSYLHFDAEIYTPSLESIHLLLRVHHRSGIYGLIAPSKVGSNFVGVGLAYYFD